MTDSSPVLTYARQYLVAKGVIGANSPLVMSEAELDLEMVGMFKPGEDTFYFFTREEGRPKTKYKGRRLHYTKSLAGKVVVALPQAVSFTIDEGATAKIGGLEVHDSGLARETQLLTAMATELIYYIVHDMKKHRRAGSVILPGELPISGSDRPYKMFLQLHGWQREPRSGLLKVDLNQRTAGNAP